MNRNSLLTGLLLTALSLPASPRGPVEAVGLFEVGKPAPRLELPLAGADGTARLEEFEGRRVLLIQFASW